MGDTYFPILGRPPMSFVLIRDLAFAVKKKGSTFG